MLHKLLDKCLSGNLRFAAYRLPGAKNSTVFIENPHAGNTSEKPRFVVHPFEVTASCPEVHIRADIHAETKVQYEEAFEEIAHWPDVASKSAAPKVPEEMSREVYTKVLEDGKQKIEQGQMKKFVLSRVARVARPKSFSIAKTFLRLADKYPNAFTYLLYTRESGIWMGASPETLIRAAGNTVYTMALAGTKKTTQNIVWSEKEKQEQAYVSSYIEHIFNRLNIKFERLKTATVISGPVAHLRTRFTASISGKTAGEITKLLHPTPAVCGEPLEVSRQFILKNEPHDRSYYSGYLGPQFNPDVFRFFVNLRCMKIHPNHLDLYVGGGITSSSAAESEWQETCLKAETLLSILND